MNQAEFRKQCQAKQMELAQNMGATLDRQMAAMVRDAERAEHERAYQAKMDRDLHNLQCEAEERDMQWKADMDKRAASMDQALMAKVEAKQELKSSPVAKPGKVWTKDDIRVLIASNTEQSAKFIERALLFLYSKQEADEAEIGYTKYRNGFGFNAVDAEILTSFAKWIVKSRRVEGQRLSFKQRALARRKLKKYAGQLTDHANGVI